MNSIIDTHMHFWDLDMLSLPWLKGIDVLNRNHLPEDYLKATGKYTPEAMVYMEVDVSESQKLKEAELIIKLIESRTDKVKATVCSAVLGKPGFDNLLAAYQKFPEICGIRQVLHVSETPPGYCLTPEFLTDIEKIFAAEMLFDLCIRPAELEDAVKLTEKFPQGLFILDHCGNPDPLIVSGKKTELKNESPFWHEVQDWKEQIAVLGKKENVVCKISGIIARIDPDNFCPEDLKPTVDHCIDSFGENRIIFGGDWPVCNLTTGLEVWIDTLKEIIKDRPDSLQKKLFSENARKIYEI